MGSRLSIVLVLLCLGLGGKVYYQTRPDNRLQLPPVVSSSSNNDNPSSAGAENRQVKVGEPEITALEALTETVDRPLFSIDRRPFSPPDRPVQVVESRKPTTFSQLVLSAVIINGPLRMALLQNPKQGAALIRAKEGQIVEGWLLKEVLPQRVVLQQGDQEQELVLRKFKPPPQELMPPVAPKDRRGANAPETEDSEDEVDLRRPRRPLNGPRLRSQQRNLRQSLPGA